MSYLTMKMTMKMTMRTAIAGEALVMKFRVVCKDVELVQEKKYFLKFFESAVAYHLCEPYL